MRTLGALLLAASCKVDAPACHDVGAHAQAHILADHPMTPAELARMVDKIPFEPKLGDRDRAHVERRCEAWSDAYRRCVLAWRGARVACGESDPDWRELPRMLEWLALANERASAATTAAAGREAKANDRVTVLETELAKAPAENRAQLETKLGSARQGIARARALAERCRSRPLEQVECVVLIPPTN